MFPFFCFFSFSQIKQLTINSNASVKIPVKENHFLIPLSPNDFEGEIQTFDENHSVNYVNVFGSTQYTIINFTVDSEISVKTKNGLSNTFYYYIFPSLYCNLINIIINPPDNHIISVTREDGRTYPLEKSMRYCFFYMWNPSYKYSIAITKDGLDKSDYLDYSTEPYNSSGWERAISIHNVQSTGVLGVKFETDDQGFYGKARIHLSTTYRIENSAIPTNENVFCVNSNESTIIDEICSFYDHFIDDGSEDAFLGILLGSLFGVSAGCLIILALLIIISKNCKNGTCCDSFCERVAICCSCCCHDDYQNAPVQNLSLYPVNDNTNNSQNNNNNTESKEENQKQDAGIQPIFSPPDINENPYNNEPLTTITVDSHNYEEVDVENPYAHLNDNLKNFDTI